MTDSRTSHVPLIERAPRNIWRRNRVPLRAAPGVVVGAPRLREAAPVYGAAADGIWHPFIPCSRACAPGARVGAAAGEMEGFTFVPPACYRASVLFRVPERRGTRVPGAWRVFGRRSWCSRSGGARIPWRSIKQHGARPWSAAQQFATTASIWLTLRRASDSAVCGMRRCVVAICAGCITYTT